MKPVLVSILLTCMTLLYSQPASTQSTPPQKPSRSAALSVFGYDPAGDFTVYDPHYRERINHYKTALDALQREMFRQAKSGRKTPCSRQIFVEAHWLIYYTAHYDQIAKRLQDLQDMLGQPADPSSTEEQSPEDGSFSPCNQQWFYKLDACCDRLVVMQYLDAKPTYPLRFLDRINSPDRFRDYMDRHRIADVRHMGEDTRYELNLAGTDLVRLILGDLPSGYVFDPQLKNIVLDYLDNKWQDPETGFWGCWYKTADGSLRKTADLSMTFHIVHYRKGKVKRWPQILRTVLVMKDLEYPFGWLQEGQMSNHHNYDVVTLLHYGWNVMTLQQKLVAKTEIRKMLDFCLHKSLKPDGSFDPGDETTLASSFEFPCLFLYEIGFFNKANRFWTEEPFPQSKEIARRIDHKLKELKLDDPEADIAALIVENAD